MTTKKLAYYTPDQINLHNAPEDCWLSWLGCVYDLTDVVKANSGTSGSYIGNVLLNPILANAGQDISNWFDPKTREVGGVADR